MGGGWQLYSAPDGARIANCQRFDHRARIFVGRDGRRHLLDGCEQRLRAGS